MSLSRCGSRTVSDGFVLVAVLATCHGPLAVGAGDATAFVRCRGARHCVGDLGHLWAWGACGLRYCWSSIGEAWAAGNHGCALDDGLSHCRFCCRHRNGTTAKIVDWLLHMSSSRQYRPWLRMGMGLESRGGCSRAVCACVQSWTGTMVQVLGNAGLLRGAFFCFCATMVRFA